MGVAHDDLACCNEVFDLLPGDNCRKRRGRNFRFGFKEPVSNEFQQKIKLQWHQRHQRLTSKCQETLPIGNYNHKCSESQGHPDQRRSIKRFRHYRSEPARVALDRHRCRRRANGSGVNQHRPKDFSPDPPRPHNKWTVQRNKAAKNPV